MAMPAPGRVSPGTTGPMLSTAAWSSIWMLRPALISSVPGPATVKLPAMMSRPARTSETSLAWSWMNRLLV